MMLQAGGLHETVSDYSIRRCRADGLRLLKSRSEISREQPFDEGRSSVVWSEGDNPNGLDFGQNFEYVFDDLPTIGEVTTPPWAGSYWPTYLDSINHRWDAQNPDNLSPSEKYELDLERQESRMLSVSNMASTV